MGAFFYVCSVAALRYSLASFAAQRSLYCAITGRLLREKQAIRSLLEVGCNEALCFALRLSADPRN